MARAGSAPASCRFSALLALALAAAQAAAEPPDRTPAQWLAGEWSNGAQYRAADPSLHRPPAAGHPYDWLDQQHARFTTVRLAGADGEAVHLVWRSGGADGPISRQRIWLFRKAAGGRLFMHFYTPAEAALLEPAPAAGSMISLRPDALVGYPEACALPVVATASGFHAMIPPDCLVTARSGRAMRLSASIVLDGDTLVYSESGTLADGSLAFKVPGGPAYRFERLR